MPDVQAAAHPDPGAPPSVARPAVAGGGAPNPSRELDASPGQNVPGEEGVGTASPPSGHDVDVEWLALLLAASIVTHLDDMHGRAQAYAEQRHPDDTCKFCDALQVAGGVRTLGHFA